MPSFKTLQYHFLLEDFSFDFGGRGSLTGEHIELVRHILNK